MSDNTLVSAFFASFSEEKLLINARAFDNASALVAERLDDINHRLAFTTYSGGQYQFCIENLNQSPAAVDVTIKVGVEAKDYTSIPNTKTLTPIEKQIKKIVETTAQVKKELSYVREREEQMRHTNKTIGERVIGYSVLTLFMLIGVSAFQIVYLRSFFRSKKLN